MLNFMGKGIKITFKKKKNCHSDCYILFLKKNVLSVIPVYAVANNARDKFVFLGVAHPGLWIFF